MSNKASTYTGKNIYRKTIRLAARLFDTSEYLFIIFFVIFLLIGLIGLHVYSALPEYSKK